MALVAANVACFFDWPAAVCFAEPVKEMTVFADQCDFAITLLLLGDQMMPSWQQDDPKELDNFDRFRGKVTAS